MVERVSPPPCLTPSLRLCLTWLFRPALYTVLAKAKGLSVLSALSAGRPADNADVADELSLTPSVSAASAGEKRRSMPSLMGERSPHCTAGLMLVRTDAIVRVQPPPVGNLVWRYVRGSPGGQFHSLVKNL